MVVALDYKSIPGTEGVLAGFHHELSAVNGLLRETKSSTEGKVLCPCPLNLTVLMSLAASVSVVIFFMWIF